MIYIVVLMMTLLGAFASISLKQSTLLSRKINWYFILGGGLYFTTALINVFVLKYLPYAVVLPMTSLTSIWIIILANIIFEEPITKRKVFGLMSIIIGVLLLTV